MSKFTRSVLPLLLAAALGLAALAAPAAAPARSRVCAGKVSGKYPVVVVRGVTCTSAKRAAAAFIRSRAPSPWRCGLAHAPFRRIAGVTVGASCGYGPRVGGQGLTGLRHAFAIGT